MNKTGLPKSELQSRYCWTPLDYVDENQQNGQCLVYKSGCIKIGLFELQILCTLKTVPSRHVETYLGCMSTTSHIQAIDYSQVYRGKGRSSRLKNGILSRQNKLSYGLRNTNRIQFPSQ